ncbi:Hypothetical predicted protein [Mytilus galloprovincialis]|uniref:Fibrinogen C-terminal domain-containing protein n=1 Tax=Mytilus galloprovincialis TaxID=29158 RepID=A0A8B6DJ96_MYTGA|nr:Hypothetical predicted protein [Mytilus galloprovincialis]
MESADDCVHRIQCGDDELCYMHHYVTESGIYGFDFGCASKQVIQRRFNGSVNFYRDWQHYKNGLGQASGEYWIGNDIIHALTADLNHALMVIMTDYNNVTKYAEYSSFRETNDKNGYQLTCGKYSGNAGDSLWQHSGHKFTTYDRDNDIDPGNCAQ